MATVVAVQLAKSERICSQFFHHLHYIIHTVGLILGKNADIICDNSPDLSESLSGRLARNQAREETAATQNKNIQTMNFFISFTRNYPHKYKEKIVSLRRKFVILSECEESFDKNV